jgi:hypothetical protein
VPVQRKSFFLQRSPYVKRIQIHACADSSGVPRISDGRMTSQVVLDFGQWNKK